MKVGVANAVIFNLKLEYPIHIRELKLCNKKAICKQKTEYHTSASQWICIWHLHQTSELTLDLKSVVSSLVNKFSYTIQRQQRSDLHNFKNRTTLIQTIGLVQSDSDKWVDPEKLQLDIASLEGFPLSIHEFFNPDAVNLDWKKRNMPVCYSPHLRQYFEAWGQRSRPWAALSKAGLVKSVWLANQIQGFRILAHSDTWEKNKWRKLLGCVEITSYLQAFSTRRQISYLQVAM